MIDAVFLRLAAELERETVQLAAAEAQRDQAERKKRRERLLEQLEGITPTEVGGARVFEIGTDRRDEPMSAVACANGCGASFLLTPRAPAAICGCDILHWAEPYFDGPVRQELLNVVTYPPR